MPILRSSNVFQGVFFPNLLLLSRKRYALASRKIFLKMRPSALDINECRRRLNSRIRNNNHNVRISRKRVNERTKKRILNLHPLELRLRLPARQLKLLNNVAYLLKAVRVKLAVRVRRVRDNEECGALE